MKQFLITALLVILSASLTANYFLYKQANALSVEPIEIARLK